MVRQLRPLSIHLGLPCGTCSRARERELPAHLRDQHSAPPPLRSAQFLMGVPDLKGINLAKVQASNVLYRFGVQLLHLCFLLDILVSVENPSRSWLWGILTLLVAEYNDPAFSLWFAALKPVDFHSCMHGGSRNKRTRLLSSSGLYEELAIDCDGNHPHAPWFVIKCGAGLSFATALEAECPKELCTRMARCLLRQAEEKHVKVGPSLSPAQTARQAWGVQTPKSKPLVPEFKCFHHSEVELSKPGLQLLATLIPGAQQTELQQDPKRVRRTCKYGVQWEPQEFLQEAKATVHPKDPHKALPDSLKKAVLQVMGHSPIDVAKHRLSVLLAVQRKSLELKEDERRLKESMDPRTAAVMANNWKYLLETTQFPDMEVVDLVVKGIPLYGAHTKPPNFPDDWKPSLISVDELLESSIWRRKSLMNAEHTKLEEQVQRDLQETTMKEVELGHLHGPFSEDEVTAHFGTDRWLFNPRFALYQGSENKVRATDDGKRSALNLCYTTNFKLELYDVDTLAALIAAVADSLKAGTVNFDLTDDTSCSVPVHPLVASDTWCGRTLDLSRAYKQLALDKASRLLSVVGYFFENKWVFFRSDVLPFGAIAAVYSFNRVSRSLHHLICKLLWGHCTCFYDDYPTISPTASSTILSKAMSSLLTYLGWDHAKVGVKAVDFAASFNALGVSVQLDSLNKGSFILCNKEGRIERLCGMLEAIKERGVISRSEPPQIQGHLNFASGFFVSKALKFLVSSFSRLADVPRHLGSDDLRRLCELAAGLLKSMPPRKYVAESFKSPFLIFTDGAWEDGNATGGALTYNPISGEAKVFEVEIPEALTAKWLEEVGDQLISQIEFFVYLALRFHCRGALLNRLGIAWIDNEAARFVAIKGSSDSFSLMSMSRVLQQVELEMPSSVWLERVCSFSNPSDMPSRKQVAMAAKLFQATPCGVLRVPDFLIDAILTLHQEPYASLNAFTTGVNSSA
eukprot:s357_g11.t1